MKNLTFIVKYLLVSISILSPTFSFAQPEFSKVFAPNEIGPGSVTTITFTIINNDESPVTDLAFTDVLPMHITIAAPTNASSTCDKGILDAPSDGNTINFSGGELGGQSSCVISVNVTSPELGTHTNTTGDLTSSAGNSGTATDDLEVSTSLPGFSKSFAPTSVFLGERSTLTFIIDNEHNTANVLNLDFTDILPAGMEIASPNNASTNCISSGGGTLIAVPGTNVISLDADGTSMSPSLSTLDECMVFVDVVGTGIGSHDNITGNLLADFTISGKASASLEVTATSLAIKKSFTNDPVAPGDSVTLNFTISNFDRNFPATEVAFTDDLTTLMPTLSGLTFSSVLSNDCGGTVTGTSGTTIGLSGATVASGASCTCSVSLAVPADATLGAYTNTSSTVTGTVDGSPVIGNTASEDLFISPIPKLTKEFLEAGTLAPDPVVQPGDDVVIQFTIENTSSTSPATDIAFNDELTDGGPGTGFLPFPVSVTLPPMPDPPCGMGSSLTLGSAGTDRQELTFTGGSLAAAPGAGSTCTFDVIVTLPDDLAPGVYSNTTEKITATVDGATRTGSEASDNLTVIAAPSLTKSFSDDPVAPGGTVTLEFTLNHSADATSPATGITFTDDLSAVLAGLTVTLPPSPDPPCGAGSTLTASAGNTLLTLMGGSLSPGSSCTFSVALEVPDEAMPGSYTNTTSPVSATEGGVMTTSQAAIDDLDIQSIKFSKEFLENPYIAGSTGTLRFTIENLHPTDDATMMSFTDNLSAVLSGLVATVPPTLNECGGTLSGTSSLIYSGGSIMSGDTCNIEVPITIPGGAADGTSTNTTSPLSTSLETIDPATDNLEVNSNLIELKKEFTDNRVAPGGNVTLDLTLTNLDDMNAVSDIEFNDNLGSSLTGLQFTSIISNDCGATVSGTMTDMITVTDGNLPAGGSCKISLLLAVPGDAMRGTYNNTTSDITGMINGLQVSGNPASDDLEVTDLLSFTKSFDGISFPGGTPSLTFTITNPGSSPATNLGFIDELNSVIPGLVATGLPMTDVCGLSSVLNGTSTISLTNGSLSASGGTCTFSVDLAVPANTAPDTFINITSAISSFGIPVSDPATADLVIVPPPTFSKTFTPDIISENGLSTLNFTIDNSGSIISATALDFTDNLPAGMIIATPASASTTCMGGTLTAVSGSGIVSYSGGSVSASSSCTLSVDVTAASAGTYANTTGMLTSSNGNSGTATSTLDVLGIASQNEITFGDPCSCTDTLNCDVSGLLYFHDTLTIPAMGMIGTGQTITITASTNFYVDVPCGAGTLAEPTANVTIIPETIAGVSGVYKIEFWRPSGILPTLSVSIGGGTPVMAPANTFMPLCFQEACNNNIPTLGQWGVILLALLLMIIGLLAVKRSTNAVGRMQQ